MSEQDSSSQSQMTPEISTSWEASLDNLNLDRYDGRHGKPLGSRDAKAEIPLPADRIDLIMERDLLQMEQNQRLLAESRSYSMLVSQLESQLTRVQTKCDEQAKTISAQAREITALQQKLALQTVQGEQKFNQFLVCANQYEQSKTKEIEALKLKLAQQEHQIATLRSAADCFHAKPHYQPHPHSPPHFAHSHHARYRLSPTSSAASAHSNSSSASCGPSGSGAYYEQMTVHQLEQLRVRQKNIVYVIGLPVSLCNAKLLKSNKWFGKFGAISRICFNTSPKCVKANSIPTFVTYVEERDALQAIRRMNLYCLADGTRLKTNFGRTKYCPLFCRKEQCLNEKCKFLHAWADHEDIITEQEITDFNAIRAGPPSRFNRK